MSSPSRIPIFAPRALDVTSRKWAFYVNSLAASPLVRDRERAAIYRRFGLRLDTERVKPGCFFMAHPKLCPL